MDGSDSGISKKNEDAAPLLSDSSNGKDKDSSIVKEVDSAVSGGLVPSSAGQSGYSVYQTTIWLLVWMLNNILVTVLNKAAFAKVNFKYPYTLSAIHMSCNILGAQLYFFFNRSVKPKMLEPQHNKSILFFSIIFSLNIAIGNTSLRWVSVNLNQVARSLVPAILMGISILYYKKTFSVQRKYAVIPIVIGVAMAFYGDMTFTTAGLIYTIACVVLAALKSIATGELLTGDLKMHEMDLLSKMSPLAFIQIGFLAIVTGEVSEILEPARWNDFIHSAAPQVILLSGLMSFTLNVSSFIANKVTSPLTLSISANVKQVLLVAFSTLYFGDPVSFLNGLGIAIVMYGSYKYTMISFGESEGR